MQPVSDPYSSMVSLENSLVSGSSTCQSRDGAEAPNCFLPAPVLDLSLNLKPGLERRGIGLV